MLEHNKTDRSIFIETILNNDLNNTLIILHHPLVGLASLYDIDLYNDIIKLYEYNTVMILKRDDQETLQQYINKTIKYLNQVMTFATDIELIESYENIINYLRVAEL